MRKYVWCFLVEIVLWKLFRFGKMEANLPACSTLYNSSHSIIKSTSVLKYPLSAPVGPGVTKYLRHIEQSWKTHTSCLQNLIQCYCHENNVMLAIKTDMATSETDKSPETKPFKYSQVIFNKGTKTISLNAERVVFSTNVLGKIGIHMQNNKAEPLLNTI